MPREIYILLLLIALAIPGFLFIVLYVYAPFKVRRTQGKPYHVDYQPIELSQLPDDVSAAFINSCRDLAAEGFTALGTLTQRVEATKQLSFVSIWLNPAVNDSAQIIGVISPSPAGPPIVVTLTVFNTEFTDRTTISTSNSAGPSCFPRDPTIAGVRTPGVHDVRLLYRFHRARVARDRGDRLATLDRSRDALERMKSEHRETFDRLVDAGYFARDEDAWYYVPTLPGAFLMTYRLLPPFKQIQMFLKDRAGNRALKQLGFGGLSAFRRMQQAPVGPTTAGGLTSLPASSSPSPLRP